VTIQAQILDLLVEMVREDGASMVLITHDLGVVAETCDRVAVMYAGRVVEVGPVGSIFAQPEHPYTRGLIACIPDLHGDGPLRPIEGSVPDPSEIGDGCAFASRCGQVHGRCRMATPALLGVAAGHSAACWEHHA
jgi:oligopeptide/dipeptide ABC transporter ATP-binding protein